jgi:DNA-binding winged helix-turn-helix (wHTH) protein/tetratricopeptide (TPR) repeat protein
MLISWISMETNGIFRFGKGFQVDAAARTLRREDELVILNRRSFDVLFYLVRNPGRVVSRDELLKKIWPDTFVDENSLTQSISSLRRALEERPGDNSYIVTVPGRGYQFASPVQIVAPESLAVVSDPANVASPSPSGVIFQQQTIRTSVITEKQTSSGQSAVPELVAQVSTLWKILVPVLLVVLLMGGMYYRSHQNKRLTEKDTIVLADFANSTGDAVFDDTLKTALNISLRQSPFLNVLPDSQVTKTLQLMTRPPNTKLTPDVARELCLRAGSKAYLAGAIASLGREYVLSIKAVNCENGDTLVQEQVAAASKEKVLDAVGRAASKLRGELGESLPTVQRFDVALAEATTPSLEALKAYSLGRKAADEQGPGADLVYFQRAIEIDPSFAIAHNSLGIEYSNLGAQDRAAEYVTKAFELRQHASERERLGLTADYYMYVTGELGKTAEALREWIEIYPRSPAAYGKLGITYAEQGQYEKAAKIAMEAAHIAPSDGVGGYENLANYCLALQRLDRAREIIQQAQTRKLDGPVLRNEQYALAFLGADLVGMAEQQKWFANQPENENWGLALDSDTQAYAGHLSRARGLTKRAVDSAIRGDSKENGAVYVAIAAQREAAYGNAKEARQAAAEAIKLAPANPGAEAEAALALAMAGDTGRAENLAQDLGKRFPLDTQIQSLWLPVIQAQLALDKKNPAAALNALQVALPVELGLIPFVNNLSCLYPTYIRGEAYLAAGQGSAAAVEFQKIIDHSGIVWNCWTGALAHLEVARANALQARTSQIRSADADTAQIRAIAAYKDFFTLWKDADPEILILKEAKAEYAKLR